MTNNTNRNVQLTGKNIFVSIGVCNRTATSFVFSHNETKRNYAVARRVDDGKILTKCIHVMGVHIIFFSLLFSVFFVIVSVYCDLTCAKVLNASLCNDDSGGTSILNLPVVRYTSRSKGNFTHFLAFMRLY